MSDVLQVRGGQQLRGEVRVAGSKNAALPMLAASLLSRDPSRLENVPRLADVDTAAGILAGLGARVERTAEGGMVIEAGGEIASEVPMDLARRMRASILFMGPLLARTGRAVVPKPGGDDIGMRRVDQHVRGFALLGAVVEEQDGTFVCTADGLHGADVYLDMPTVTGTENIMMAAVLADGNSTISNAAREPHVADLAVALNSMGAQISGAGTDRIQISGVEVIRGMQHRVVPDYLEAGTYAIAAAAAGGDVKLVDAPVEDLRALIVKLQEAGVEVETGGDWMSIKREGPLRPVDLITWTHPGFATDLQPQFTALMTQADGDSVIQEFLYDNRFMYVNELLALGAQIDVVTHGRGIRVHGPSSLRGNVITIPDIRSGAALLIAALCARGGTLLRGVEHLDRGYEDVAGKLSRLGANLNQGALTAS